MSYTYDCVPQVGNTPSGRAFWLGITASIVPLLAAVLVRRVFGWPVLPATVVLASGPLLAALALSRSFRLRPSVVYAALLLSLTIIVPSLLSEAIAQKMFAVGWMGGWYIIYLEMWWPTQSSSRLIVTTIIFSAIQFGVVLLSL